MGYYDDIKFSELLGKILTKIELKEVRYRFGNNNMFVNNLIRAIIWQIEEHEVIIKNE